MRLCPWGLNTLKQLQENPLVLSDSYPAALFTSRELNRIIGSKARSDSVTGNRVALCIMGNLLMCIKLGADGATRQPGSTLGTYAFSTPHRGHSFVQCLHRRPGLNFSETRGIWPNPEALGNLENRLDFVFFFYSVFRNVCADGKVK
jgi:hypothetical protein